MVICSANLDQLDFFDRGMARPPGLEPGTYSLEGCCTIQLCYGRKAALNAWVPMLT